MQKRSLSAFAALSLLSLSPLATADLPSAPPEELRLTIAGALSLSSEFDTLLFAAEAAGLSGALSSPGDLTVFAPTDRAFSKLPKGTLEALTNDVDELRRILEYHVLTTEVFAETVVGGGTTTTLLGEDIDFGLDENGAPFIGNAGIQITDINVSNGVIHVIDAVLLPPQQPDVYEFVQEAEGFDTLELAIDTAMLAETLQGEGPFTVFAPTDAAFAAFDQDVLADLLANPAALADVLLYHVVPGELFEADVLAERSLATALPGASLDVTLNRFGAFVNMSKIELTNIEVANGVIHVIDAVLVPPAGE